DEVKKKGFDIDSIENLANDLEKELTLKSEDFKDSYERKKITWRSIQTIIKPDEAAVEVIRFRKGGKIPNKFNPKVLVDGFTDTVCYAFLIVSEKTEEHPDLVVLENGKQLENEYYNYYRTMIKSKFEDNKSYSRYWEKLHEKLKGYKKIYLSADGIYNKLNPSTLLMPDGKYLLDVYDIQQLNSTKDILLGFYETKQESNIYNSAVLIGNPNFALSEEEVRKASERIRSESEESEIWEPMASTRGIKLTKLPGTETEIKDVEKFLESRKWDVKSYVGDMALKTAVKAANSPRVLHIATHGMFLEDVKRESSQMFGFDEQRMVENPLLRSGLFFTGADNYLKAEDEKPTGDVNGVLTAYEAMNLNLDHTELVVLSACETGLGEIKNGEGVFGLRRAFQTAGAKTIVMSLWTVSDQATQELMSSFYSNWVTGMTKREAFSKAQQTIKAKYKDPYYWGAFVMVGE
ncbi:CHAT domain-containing protein, partial [Bacteroidota bacterium]